MRIKKLLWMLPAASLVGCVYSHGPAAYAVKPAPATVVATPAPTTVIRPAPSVVVPAPPPTPTSVGSDVRVYPDPKLSITTPVPPPVKTTTVPGVIATSDPRDVAVTDEIRQVLQADTARIYRNVDFAIDRGTVTVRGTVPTDHDRLELQTRLATLPGVTAVDNKLDVELR